jgi:hypothetical protein
MGGHHIDAACGADRERLHGHCRGVALSVAAIDGTTTGSTIMVRGGGGGGGDGDESLELCRPGWIYSQMTSLQTDGASVLALWNNEGVAIRTPNAPRDLNQRAKRMVDIATGDLNRMAPPAKELAIALGRKGGRAEKFRVRR